MKRSLLFTILSMLIVLGMILSACAPAAQAPAEEPVTEPPVSEPPAEEPVAEPAPAEEAGVVNISFWHSMGGDLGGVAIPQMADNFNASQTQCFVEPIYQGSYDDALNKLKAGLQSRDTPAVMQLYDIGTRLMVDLKVITPVQEFIDKREL
jgi:sn-glycerol 3-phosphate transport system substrate-binding protein